MLNDSVATLLGGKASYPDREFESYMGFILGTGTNTCYIEENSNILKAGNLSEKGSMIINIESGGYNRIKRGTMDIEFDNETKDPGDYCFEKMLSGRYQGGLLMKVIEKAAGDGLLSKKFKEEISNIKDITLPEINEFMYYPYSKSKLSMCCSDDANNKHDDHLILCYLIDSIVERAAKLVTINLASVLIKTGKGKNPCRPVCITADGSTFYKLNSLSFIKIQKDL